MQDEGRAVVRGQAGLDIGDLKCEFYSVYYGHP